jgi:hypothetical protein
MIIATLNYVYWPIVEANGTILGLKEEWLMLLQLYISLTVNVSSYCFPFFKTFFTHTIQDGCESDKQANIFYEI